MAEAAKIPGRPLLVRHPHHVIRARWATNWLILFMLIMFGLPAIPFWIDRSGEIAAFIKSWVWIVLFVYYLPVQLHETATRSSTDQAGMLSDNGLAMIATFIGFGTFLLWTFAPWYRLTPDQGWIVFQCTVVTTIDLVFGVVYSQRIAFAGKEREEEAPGG